jgi:hypothetical protein
MLKHLASLFSFLAATVLAQPLNIVRVSAPASGGLLLDGKPADIRTIDAAFQRLKASKGTVWYHRENARAEPSPEAISVIKLVVQYGLPVSMSTKPDFSDYVDASGHSQVRK